MKDRIAEMVLFVVIVFLLITSGVFWYDRATNKFIREQEQWRKDVTSIVNHNFNTGQLSKPGVPPIPQPPRK